MHPNKTSITMNRFKLWPYLAPESEYTHVLGLLKMLNWLFDQSLYLSVVRILIHIYFYVYEPQDQRTPSERDSVIIVRHAAWVKPVNEVKLVGVHRNTNTLLTYLT